MKIAIDCRMIGSGGIGSYISSLLPYFSKNHECILIGNEIDLTQFNEKNVKIIPCAIKTFTIKELFFFPKKITKIINDCDIFYSPYCNIPSGVKIPIYTTIHDVVFLDILELTGKIGILLRKFFYQYAINKSTTIFTVSNFSKQRIEHHLNTKNKNIIVTYNALPQWFAFSPKTNIPIKQNYILFVGNIKRHKGLHTLLNAFSNLLNNGISTKLLIVGNSQNFRTKDSTIWNEITKLPEGTVEFTGRVSDEELKNIYASAKVLVQPSLYEGFGMPPLEALCLGTDVVLSDIPVFKEIYNNFPVTFFKCEDHNDLSNVLLKNWNNYGTKSISLPDIYSFENTYQIIEKTIKKD